MHEVLVVNKPNSQHNRPNTRKEKDARKCVSDTHVKFCCWAVDGDGTAAEVVKAKVSCIRLASLAEAGGFEPPISVSYPAFLFVSLCDLSYLRVITTL